MRSVIAHTLFWIGDRISCALYWFPSEVPHRLDWLETAVYRTYNWFMCLSRRVQGGGPGPWSYETTNE